MNRKKVIAKLRTILKRADVDSEGLINRKASSKHTDEMEVLLEHISLLITDLRFDSESSRRELFSIRALLEE